MRDVSDAERYDKSERSYVAACRESAVGGGVEGQRSLYKRDGRSGVAKRKSEPARGNAAHRFISAPQPYRARAAEQIWNEPRHCLSVACGTGRGTGE